MHLNAYTALDPDEGDPIWNDLHRMADEMEWALSRVLRAIHAFEKGPRDISESPSKAKKIDPPNIDDVIEVYLVPALYNDASALLGVDHDKRVIRYISIYERLFPIEDNPVQWDEITVRAAAWRGAAKAEHKGA